MLTGANMYPYGPDTPAGQRIVVVSPTDIRLLVPMVHHRSPGRVHCFNTGRAATSVLLPSNHPMWERRTYPVDLRLMSLPGRRHGGTAPKYRNHGTRAKTDRTSSDSLTSACTSIGPRCRQLWSRWSVGFRSCVGGWPTTHHGQAGGRGTARRVPAATGRWHPWAPTFAWPSSPNKTFLRIRRR